MVPDLERCNRCKQYENDLISIRGKNCKSVFILCYHKTILLEAFKKTGFNCEFGCPLEMEKR